jgi:hypothetical protein
MAPQPTPCGQTYMGAEDLRLLTWQVSGDTSDDSVVRMVTVTPVSLHRLVPVGTLQPCI